MGARLLRRAVLGLVFGTLALSTRAVPAEPPPVKDDVAGALVREALRSEADAASSQRQTLLETALRRDPKSAAARWHSGQVRLGDEWVAVEAVAARSASDADLAEYLACRGRYADDAAGQLELAQWCRDRGLTEQMRAHLARVLTFAPDHLVARAMLGQQRVAGVWMSAEDIRVLRSRERQVRKALAFWSPRVQRIGVGLASRSEERRETAREQLGEIRDPSAIIAIERLLSAQNPEAAENAVRQVAALGGYEAAVSLARHAVYSAFPEVREIAIAELKRYPLDSYAPPLLAALSTPLLARSEFRSVASGVVRQDIVRREGQYEEQLLATDAQYLGEAALVSARARDDAREFQQNVADENARIQRLNERICTVLKQVAPEAQADGPDGWWRWWNEHNEVFVPDEKPVAYSYLGGTTTEVTPPPPTPGSDCLAAGTPVWTNLGPKPVESIQVGDLVLSQHPETGELAYKPVLATTVRPPSPLITVAIRGGDTIRASGGHPFWVSGRGWTKARELQAGVPLHHAEGSVSVTSVEREESPQQAFNLIVADFHTYFVGESRVLSHDNTIRQPTDAIVPGLVER